MRLRNLLSVGLTVDDVEDWERLITPAEAARDRRRVEGGEG